MKKSYRAMQVSEPGLLELVERDTPQPGAGEVLIQVEACGICGADAGVIEGREPLAVLPGQLVGSERMVQGSITGTPFESEKTLDFSVLADVRPLIETMPLENALDAYRRMMSGQARYRMVLTMGPQA